MSRYFLKLQYKKCFSHQGILTIDLGVWNDRHFERLASQTYRSTGSYVYKECPNFFFKVTTWKNKAMLHKWNYYNLLTQGLKDWRTEVSNKNIYKTCSVWSPRNPTRFVSERWHVASLVAKLRKEIPYFSRRIYFQVQFSSYFKLA